MRPRPRCWKAAPHLVWQRRKDQNEDQNVRKTSTKTWWKKLQRRAKTTPPLSAAACESESSLWRSRSNMLWPAHGVGNESPSPHKPLHEPSTRKWGSTGFGWIFTGDETGSYPTIGHWPCCFCICRSIIHGVWYHQTWSVWGCYNKTPRLHKWEGQCLWQNFEGWRLAIWPLATYWRHMGTMGSHKDKVWAWARPRSENLWDADRKGQCVMPRSVFAISPAQAKQRKHWMAMDVTVITWSLGIWMDSDLPLSKTPSNCKFLRILGLFALNFMSFCRTFSQVYPVYSCWLTRKHLVNILSFKQKRDFDWFRYLYFLPFACCNWDSRWSLRILQASWSWPKTCLPNQQYAWKCLEYKCYMTT